MSRVGVFAPLVAGTAVDCNTRGWTRRSLTLDECSGPANLKPHKGLEGASTRERQKSMKRIHVLALALLALFAVSMVAVAAASAVEFLLARWLEGAVNVTATLLVETEGELELVARNGGGLGVTAKALCSGILDGWVGPESLDFTSELLTLTGTVVSATPLTGSPFLACTNEGNCEKPEVWAAKLGWETEAELMVDSTETFFVDLILNGGWYTTCTVLGVKVSEECTAPETAVKLTNEAGGTVDGEFSDAFQELAGLKLGNCTLGGSESAEVNGLGVTLESGVTLTVSSE